MIVIRVWVMMMNEIMISLMIVMVIMMMIS